jgi:hypothetical protein
MNNSQKLTIENDFNIEDIVFLKHDAEQLPRIVNSIIINKHHIQYEVISGVEVSIHNSYELSKDKTIY